jgi:hypothetical protein
MPHFTFPTCRIATHEGSEEAVLCMRDGIVFAILAPASTRNDRSGWHLHVGFGPCDRKDLTFADLSEARAWLDAVVAAEWKGD